MVKSLDWKSVLKDHPVFWILKKKELEGLIKASVERAYEQGQTIIKAGELGGSVYLIGSGAVDVVLPWKDADNIHLTTLRTGEFFGEMAVFEEQPRSATVIAREKCLLLEIDGKKFLKLAKQYPEIEVKVTTSLSARLRRVGEQIIKVQHDLHEKVEVLNKRLDLELKTIDATLTATQTVFDQTNKRANEIIESADRSRTRLTAAASVIGGGITAVVAVFGFLGISQLQNLDKHVDKAEMLAEKASKQVAEAETLAAKAETYAEKASQVAERANEDAARIEATTSMLDSIDGQVKDFFRLTVIPRFVDEVQTDPIAARQTYKAILAARDRFITEELFKTINIGILAADEEGRHDYVEVLNEGINKRYVKTPRQIVLSYYSTLWALILDGKFSEYDVTFKRFENYSKRHKDTPIKATLGKEFDLSEFRGFIDALNPDKETSDFKKTKITEVWGLIP